MQRQNASPIKAIANGNLLKNMTAVINAADEYYGEDKKTKSQKSNLNRLLILISSSIDRMNDIENDELEEHLKSIIAFCDEVDGEIEKHNHSVTQADELKSASASIINHYTKLAREKCAEVKADRLKTTSVATSTATMSVVNKIEKLGAELEAAISANSSLAAESKSEIASLKQRLEEQQAQNAAQIESLTKQLQESRAETSSALSDNQSIIVNHTRELAAANDENDALKQSIKDHQSELKSTNETFSALTSEHRSALSTIESMAANHARTVTDLREENQRLQAELTSKSQPQLKQNVNKKKSNVWKYALAITGMLIGGALIGTGVGAAIGMPLFIFSCAMTTALVLTSVGAATLTGSAVAGFATLATRSKPTDGGSSIKILTSTGATKRNQVTPTSDTSTTEHRDDTNSLLLNNPGHAHDHDQSTSMRKK